MNQVPQRLPLPLPGFGHQPNRHADPPHQRRGAATRFVGCNSNCPAAEMSSPPRAKLSSKRRNGGTAWRALHAHAAGIRGSHRQVPGRPPARLDALDFVAGSIADVLSGQARGTSLFGAQSKLILSQVMLEICSVQPLGERNYRN
jgi:hypothetical protein